MVENHVAFTGVFSPAIASSPESLTIAAASDLRFALDDILDQYKKKTPGLDIKVIYGLFAEHFAVTEPEVYAVGRIVIWSRKMDASNMTLHDLLDASIRGVAIAQPSHAPYGLRAQEAMIAVGVWEAIQPKLVFGENIAHTAQMVESEAADVGIIALSLALFPDLATHDYHLIDDGLHNPLTQAYVVTHHGRNNAAAHAFANYMTGDEAHTIMVRYGFVLPGFNPQGQ